MTVTVTALIKQEVTVGGLVVAEVVFMEALCPCGLVVVVTDVVVAEVVLTKRTPESVEVVEDCVALVEDWRMLVEREVLVEMDVLVEEMDVLVEED